jgi:O-antigen/teichoic acid export membrane protein
MTLSRRLRELLPKGSFAQGVAVLAGGTALGQGLALLASPILTRLYSPEHFGGLAVYASVLGILTVSVSLRYELAIPIAPDETTAGNLLRLALLLVVASSLGLLVVTSLFGAALTRYLSVPELAGFLWLIPVGVLAVGTYQVLNYWAIRQQAFGIIAKTKLSQSLGLTVTQLALGMTKVGTLGLILGQVIGQAAGGGTLSALLRRSRLGAATRQGLYHVALRYRKFPLLSSGAGVLNALSVHIAPLLLLPFFGGSVTGWYAFAVRVLQTPLGLVGGAVGQVFFSSASRAKEAGTLKEETMRAFSRLVQLGFPSLVLVGLAAPDIFSLVFGQNWYMAGVYAQWLTPWLLLVFISSPLSVLPSIMEQQGYDLLFQFILLLGRVATLLIGGHYDSSALALMLYGTFSAICWLAFMFWNMSLSGNPVTHTLQPIIRELPFVILSAAPLLLAKALQLSSGWIAAAFFMGGLLALVRVALLGRSRPNGSAEAGGGRQ